MFFIFLWRKKNRHFFRWLLSSSRDNERTEHSMRSLTGQFMQVRRYEFSSWKQKKNFGHFERMSSKKQEWEREKIQRVQEFYHFSSDCFEIVFCLGGSRVGRFFWLLRLREGGAVACPIVHEDSRVILFTINYPDAFLPLAKLFRKKDLTFIWLCDFHYISRSFSFFEKDFTPVTLAEIFLGLFRDRHSI